MSEERLPLLAPEGLGLAQRELYEAVARGPRARGPFSVTDSRGRLLGPFNALLHHPGIGSAVERLGSALRFDGTLPARTRELVTCAVAVHWASDYEWYAHRRAAAATGVSESELAAVAAGQVPEGLAPSEESALRLAHVLLRDRYVDRDLFDRVAEHHDSAEVVEIITLVGYYQLLAGLLAAADVGAPEEE